MEGYEGSYGADYIGSFVYNNDDDGFIRDIRFGDGIVRETSNGVYETLYWVTDHLGSSQVAFTLDDSEYGVYVAERNDYYPFGGRWDDGSGHGGTIAATDNRYALSGKERQTMSRMGSYQAAHESLLDFGARFYDPATAIFLQQDPLAEKYYNLSPYAYCANNPVNFVDPDGEAWIKALKTTGKAVYKTVKAGRKVSVKGVLKSTALDIVDNVHTLFDQDASGLEKAIAGFDLVTGFGDEAKLLAKTVGISDAIVDGNRATDAVKNRVKLRKSTRETIIEQAPKNANGDFIDPNTGMIVSKDGPFDIGHKQGES